MVRRGRAWALPELAHSVHVEVDGLRPDREWFYRFRYRHDLSPVGRTRTAPTPGRAAIRWRSPSPPCQAWDNGFYPSYRHMAGEDLDLVLHLGDYVYEGGIPADGGYRQTPTPEVLREAPRDRERWRMQYALYKSDVDLQAAHARFPWVVTWDDHEVQNDYANTQSQYEGDISALRAAAYQAWYEHQPVRHDGPAGELLWHDAWDGFPAARNRLTEAWVEHKVSNPVVVTGDWHSTFVNDILRNFDDPVLAGGGLRAGRHVHLEQRRRRGLRPVLRPDDRVQPPHQVLRR